MGSVKDLKVIKEPKKDKLGVGRFFFTDRYSIFDWGEMPDHIPDKGRSLCILSAFFFERLEEEGIKTHYNGLVYNDKVYRLEELDLPTDEMDIKLVRVIKPRFDPNTGLYNYSSFNRFDGNYLIPFEFIYRNKIAPESSFLKRFKEGSIDLNEYGLDEIKINEHLERPILDVSTKLEKGDRYLGWREVRDLVRLDIEKIKDLVLSVVKVIDREVSAIGIDNVDGKLELAYTPEKDLMVVDTVGTLDECRFVYNDMNLSKEAIRRYYIETDWKKDLDRAKKEAREKNIDDWKSLCRLRPERLDPIFKDIISDMYKSATNMIIKRKIFDAQDLDDVMRRYNDYLDEKQEL